MRDAFADYLRENTAVKAIFVGTRRTDPHGGKLGTFQPTDGGWPSFMRVHPVIEWKYADVWAVSLPTPSSRTGVCVLVTHLSILPKTIFESRIICLFLRENCYQANPEGRMN